MFTTHFEKTRPCAISLMDSKKKQKKKKRFELMVGNVIMAGVVYQGQCNYGK